MSIAAEGGHAGGAPFWGSPSYASTSVAGVSGWAGACPSPTDAFMRRKEPWFITSRTDVGLRERGRALELPGSRRVKRGATLVAASRWCGACPNPSRRVLAPLCVAHMRAFVPNVGARAE